MEPIDQDSIRLLFVLCGNRDEEEMYGQAGGWVGGASKRKLKEDL
jgi:hypothetical protein